MKKQFLQIFPEFQYLLNGQRLLNRNEFLILLREKEEIKMEFQLRQPLFGLFTHLNVIGTPSLSFSLCFTTLNYQEDQLFNLTDRLFEHFGKDADEKDRRDLKSLLNKHELFAKWIIQVQENSQFKSLQTFDNFHFAMILMSIGTGLSLSFDFISTLVSFNDLGFDTTDLFADNWLEIYGKT